MCVCVSTLHPHHCIIPACHMTCVVGGILASVCVCVSTLHPHHCIIPAGHMTCVVGGILACVCVCVYPPSTHITGNVISALSNIQLTSRMQLRLLQHRNPMKTTIELANLVPGHVAHLVSSQFRRPLISAALTVDRYNVVLVHIAKGKKLDSMYTYTYCGLPDAQGHSVSCLETEGHISGVKHFQTHAVVTARLLCGGDDDLTLCSVTVASCRIYLLHTSHHVTSTFFTHHVTSTFFTHNVTSTVLSHHVTSTFFTHHVTSTFFTYHIMSHLPYSHLTSCHIYLLHTSHHVAAVLSSEGIILSICPLSVNYENSISILLMRV